MNDHSGFQKLKDAANRIRANSPFEPRNAAEAKRDARFLTMQRPDSKEARDELYRLLLERERNAAHFKSDE